MSAGLSKDEIKGLEARLQESRATWADRLDRIQSDRRRKSGLEQDFADQAVQRENDETLDALDVRGRDELAAIDAALERIARGEYGTCAACRADIPIGRLQASPESAHCAPCAANAGG